MKSTEKAEKTESKPLAPKAVEGAPADPKGADPQGLDKKKARWDETRGLLQQALAEWEDSEKKAQEALKDAETQKLYIEDMMKQLKLKLDEFSS